jgi:hypothetical protein
MLGSVVKNGGRIPLCCENIAEPFVRREDTPEAVESPGDRGNFS